MKRFISEINIKSPGGVYAHRKKQNDMIRVEKDCMSWERILQ
jgi:hypothetical protein